LKTGINNRRIAMNLMDSLLIEPLRNCFIDIMKFLPTVLTSFMILFIGIILAVCMRFIFQRIFRALKLDIFLERSGLVELLKKGGIRENPSIIFARLIGWLTFLMFALTAINTLQIEIAGRFFEGFLMYLPHLFAALIIFLVGYLFSNFIYRTVLIAAVNADNHFAGTVSKAAKYAVIFLSITMALEQLGIGKGTVVIAFAIIFGGIVLGCAIAFGLGGRDIAKKYLEKHLKEEKEEQKDEINYL
jgi:hypothetical protein